MALTLPSNTGRVLASSALIVGIALIAAMMGFVVALFPISFSLGLIGLLGLLVLFLMAVILPAHLNAPGGLLRGMLSVVMVVSAVWPGYVAYKFGAAPGVNPARIVYWGMVTLWLFWLVGSPTLRAHLFAQLGRFKVLHGVLVIYAVWQLVICAFSLTPIYSAYYLVKLLLGGYLYYLIVLSVLRDSDDVERLVTWIVVAAALVSAIGVVEGFRKANFFAGIFPTDPEQLETLEWIILDKSRSGAYRVASTFSHPLALAEYLTMCLPLAAYLMLVGQTRWRRWLGIGAIPLLLISLYLSHTRSALITAAIVAITLMLIAGARAAAQRRNFFQAIVGGCVVVGVVLASVGGASVLTELTLGRDSAERGSTDARVVMLSRGSRMAAEEPVTGYGPGRAAITLGALPGHVNLTIDNYYLSVVLESGLPGLLLLIFTLAYPITLGFFRGLRQQTRAGWMALALASALLAYAVERGVLSLTNNLDFSLMLTAMLVVVELQIRSERKVKVADRNHAVKCAA